MGLEGGAQPESTLRNGGSSMARPPAAWWPLRGSQTLSSNTLLLARGRPPPLCWVSALYAAAAVASSSGHHTICDPQPDAAGVSPELQPRVQRRVRPAERPGQVQSSPLLPEGRGSPWYPQPIIPPARGTPSPSSPSPAALTPQPVVPQPVAPQPIMPQPIVPPPVVLTSAFSPLGLHGSSGLSEPLPLRPAQGASSLAWVQQTCAGTERPLAGRARRVRGPAGLLAAALTGARCFLAGLSAAAPALVETGLPSHAVAPSSEPGLWGQAALQNRLF
ncbi:PREDICTED: vegetative cell wall protein gp1-like [Capra hircus]|uniref:vegetative cell wall protein gp1-like n=1 Tax=Capra hircus TaxID=9925 RepID=UPI0008467355|nr:PREDICTED: vegetative cell wall protein gp1-like [Capra hircus]